MELFNTRYAQEKGGRGEGGGGGGTKRKEEEGKKI